MRALSHIIFSLLFVILAVVPASGASVKIHGKITDSKNEPVEFATVRIGGTAIGVTSGLEGDYSLSCAQSDTITVFFSCIGYREVKRQLIDPQADVTLNVMLPLDTEMLQQVEVTELKKQTGSVERLDVSDIRRSPDASGAVSRP